jgi:nucleoside-diphosphate-sugar epimerase
MGIDKFRFDGKQVLVVGGATGMGAASAVIAQDLGAQVTVMDYAEISLAGATAIKVDLRSEASIDAALAGGQTYDVVLSCAGAADGTPGIEKINFIGHRHLIERRPPGSAGKRNFLSCTPIWIRPTSRRPSPGSKRTPAPTPIGGASRP